MPLRSDPREPEGTASSESAIRGNESEFLPQRVGQTQERRCGRIPSAPLDTADLSLLNARQLGQRRLSKGLGLACGRKHSAKLSTLVFNIHFGRSVLGPVSIMVGNPTEESATRRKLLICASL